jgi:hypothetical protein
MVRLELSLLGGFHAQVDGSPAVGLDTDKTRALLVYLSVESSRAHTRDALAGLLWPDLPDDAARRNLRNSLFKLRQVLGEEEGGSGLLRITPRRSRWTQMPVCDSIVPLLKPWLLGARRTGIVNPLNVRPVMHACYRRPGCTGAISWRVSTWRAARHLKSGTFSSVRGCTGKRSGCSSG